MGAKSILDYLDEIEAEEFSLDEEQKVRYQITNTAEAEKAVHVYKKTMDEVTKLQQQADNWLESQKKKYNDYVNNAIGSLVDKAEFFEAKLRNFAEHDTAVTKKKSTKLINGTLQFTKTQDKYEYDDEVILDFIHGLGKKDELRSFLKPQPDKLDWKGMKEKGEVRLVQLEDGTSENHLFVNNVEIPQVVVKTNLPPSFKIK